MSRRYAQNRHRYPENWPMWAGWIKDVAGWHCEGCGAPHGPSPRVLTVHHLDHVPAHCYMDNLIALCQRCHLRLGARIYTREQAIRYLQTRYAADLGQLCFPLITREEWR
jgi:5-methylcytosine-specific restriction endonuclease McrA